MANTLITGRVKYISENNETMAFFDYVSNCKTFVCMGSILIRENDHYRIKVKQTYIYEETHIGAQCRTYALLAID